MLFQTLFIVLWEFRKAALLFLIFYKDLPYALSCTVDAYADDSTMTVSDDNLEDIGSTLTENCKIVRDWMVGNKLKLNAEKTHLLTVGTSARLRIQETSLKVSMDDVELTENDDQSEMLLGVHVQSDLKWHIHVNYLLSKLQTRLNALERLRYILPFTQRNL